MVVFPLSFVFLGLLALLSVGNASPVDRKHPNSTNPGVVPHPNAVPAAPRFVIYSDRFVSGITGPPPVSEVVVCCVFLLLEFVFLTLR